MALLALLAFEKRWARTALESTFPSRAVGRVHVDYKTVDVEGSLDEMLLVMPARSGMGLRAAIWLIALSPLFMIGRLTTIGGLAGKDRERLLVELLAHRYYVVRQLVLLFKAYGALFIFRDGSLRSDVLRRAQQPTGLSVKKVARDVDE